VLIKKNTDRGLLPAGGTKSEYGQVMYVSFKPMVLDEGLLQRYQLVLGKVEHFATPGTYQVVMPAVFPGVIADDAVADADFSRQTQLFQELKRAVNGRDIGVRVFFLQPLEYFLCADVPFSAMERIHHHNALGCKAITFGL
jgi:hypothetical protein